MKKILLSILIIITFNTFSFGAVYNQDNKISIPHILDIIQKFESNINTQAGISIRKNTLHKLSLQGARTTQQLNNDTLGFIFHMIKLQIGEDKFQAGLDKLSELKDMPKLTWLQVLRCFSDINADSFYDAYFARNPIIQLTVKNAEYITEKGNYYISFTLLRHFGDNIVNIPYILDYDNKKEYGRLQSSINREETFKVPVQLGNAKLILDPYYYIIRNLTYDEQPPVIADILYTKNEVLYIGDNYNTINSIFKSATNKIDSANIKFKDIENNNIIIDGYNNKFAKFFADKHTSNESNSEYFIVKNPLNQNNYILLMNNVNTNNLHLLENNAFNQELIFKNDKLVSKSTINTDNGIKVLEHKKDVVIDTQKLDTFQEMMNKANMYKTIFIGESHNEYSHHANQLRVIKHFYDAKKSIAIGMEMVQYKYLNVLNDFVKGRITEKEMLDNIDYYNNWSFDYSLYAPIFKYARDNNIDIIPLNIEREITSQVFQGNIDNLTDEQYQALPERMNIVNNDYENKLKSIYELHTNTSNKNFADFFLSQNIWDEIMAKHLSDYRKANPDTTIVVVCGNGHAGKNTGIPFRYRRLTGENSFVIMQGDNINQEEKEADFYIYPEPIKSQGTPKIGITINIEENKKGIVKVETVAKQSPASESGIKKDDIITKCGYHNITNIGILKYALYEKGYNSTLECEIKRGKNIIKRSIKLFEYDDSAEMIKEHIAKMKNK